MVLRLRNLPLLLGFLAATLAGEQTATPLPPLPPPQPAFPLPTAQTLTYEVDWRLFPAGTVTIRLDSSGPQATPSGHPLEHITATAATLGSVSLLYRVNDRFESAFDRTTGCSTFLSKTAEEGRRRVNTDVRFDYSKGRQFLTEKNLVKANSKQQDAPIPACVSDVLSAIFYIGTQPLVPGQPFHFPIADSLRTVSVSLNPEAREDIKVPAGNFKTVRVQPTADAGIVKNRGQIWLWYSDDPRHLPVQIKARLFWGTLTFRLTAVDNK